ncbi:transglycosylase domain-containing protein [Acidisoma cellulosilytica]|uniref:Transglycosylase domain-containing protein n=2 Tax=Acidisoma cellulosilyticum TaxID=2802395 RepID=A0A963YYS7_9PROT|nr:transglycosylase domain-containing protein [Acidisoma cellulosilyticum]
MEAIDYEVPEPPLERVRRAGRGWTRLLLPLLKWCILIGVWGGLAVAVLLLWFTWDLPKPSAGTATLRRPSLVLTDMNGKLFTHFGDLSGQPLTLKTVPAYLPEAVVAVEDRRFWDHGGLDFLGMARATVVDLLAGRVVQGGSTLTQQVAKTLFLSNARTFRRKMQELLLTLWLTHHFTPTEILEIYLNRVYLGAGAWGMDAAALTYFGVPASQLNLWQAAMLAGLPRAPSRFNPLADQSAATARTKEVLAAMVRSNYITQDQADAAVAAISFAPHAVSGDYWFSSWAAQQAGPMIPADTDSRLATTFDPKLQAAAQAALTDILAGPGAAANAHQGAVVVLDAATGAVRAMVGGSGGGHDFFNRAVLARRQAGSSFKAFVWLAALEAGMQPSDMVLDGPIRIGDWAPQDFERRFRGPVTMTEGLALSLNTVSARLLMKAGGPLVVGAVAHRLGVTDPLPDNATLALGTASVGLLEMTGAYATFFNGGRRVVPHGITGLYADGHDLVAAPPPATPVISSALAGEMRQMLGAVVAYGTATAAAVPGYFVGGKTGTTQSSRDAWFIGGVDGHIIGVWIGNDDNSPMSKTTTGGSLPAALFHSVALAVTGQ